MSKRKAKSGGIFFGKLKVSKKKGPFGFFTTRKILTGRNKGKVALWSLR